MGQINRGHYALIQDATGRTVGFLGWALCDEATGEAWLVGCDFVDGAARSRDCIVFNAWSAETPAANAAVLEAARRAMLGRRLAYFRRLCPDGTSRAMRMPVNRFVGRRLAASGN